MPSATPVDQGPSAYQVLAALWRRCAGHLAFTASPPTLLRACGLRIGELLDLELGCVHEVPGQGSLLKVPLGKLETERMVTLDEGPWRCWT